MRRFALTLLVSLTAAAPFAVVASDAKPAPAQDARSLGYEFAFRGHPGDANPRPPSPVS